MGVVKIDRSSDNITLNSKNEWNLQMSVNVEISRGFHNLKNIYILFKYFNRKFAVISIRLELFVNV